MNTLAIPERTCISPCHQGGLSLIELMISLTIGLVLLTGITTLIVQQSSTRSELEKASREIENGRYAVQLLHDDIQLAGFYGEYSPASGVAYTVPADPCNVNPGSTNSGWDATPKVPVPVYGYAGAAADPTTATTCGLTNYKPNTAILVVRRTATAAVSVATAAAGTTYLQVSECNTSATPFVLGTGGFSLQQKDCATPADLRQYLVDVYYISSCDVCGTDTIPTLKMVQSGPAAAPVITPLVEGIENMQFDYGIDNTGDGAPDTYTATPAATDWQNVMAVQVNLLARNNDPTVGYQDTKTYSLSAVSGVSSVGPFNDSFKRHAYSELVRAINPSGRRE
ncbi:PilW family protein [Sideroxydans lithotrophicus]|uniref:Putative type 4 fimbrial biogenesis PilW-related protein transmembrane n=1 Tax=Sideroxydans lithotrophicus (strain ES-1) TaxID=580332 RepID=D5CUK5_SIDLE|nr:PilW family protein [Sideroxydans lithotrophicus]ADE12392.1 putative type 4 fimbrial biogenesis PilW-related protein transmembrane [Sideroxydans lithotrophicus ES-1]